MQIYLANQRQALQLPGGETRSLRLNRPVQVRIQSGLVWLTVEQGSGDIWLRAGQEFALPGPGLVVIEAVGTAAALEIVPQPSLLSRLAAYWAPRADPVALGNPSSNEVRITRLLPRGLIRWF